MNLTSSVFPSAVHQYWDSQIAGDVCFESAFLRAVRNDELSFGRRVTMLTDQVSGRSVIAAHGDVWEQIGRGNHTQETTLESVASQLRAIGIEMHAPDLMFYPPELRPAHFAETPAEPPVGITCEVLDAESADHALLFSEFEARASAEDLEKAQVALDDWLAVGVVLDGKLEGVASLYPWGDDTFADIGVLTLSGSRGSGVGRSLVQFSQSLVRDKGFVLQYRCQLDNLASRALALSAGLQLYSTWSIPAEADEA